MMMENNRHSKSRRAATTARVFALLLVICLIECAAEQRINRGSKPSHLIDKINGWRSQRGGSCLSYGHSCWGAHGKRSGKPPAAAPDWYLTRILRSMAANAEMKHARRTGAYDDLNAIFRGDKADGRTPDKIPNENAEGPMETQYKTLEAKPMLDDDILSKMNLWQMMRDSSENK